MLFYRLLGLDLPEEAQDGHVEATMANGTRLMFDAEDVIASFLPNWRRTDGNQVSLAFECASPAEVDEVYARIVAAGFEGEKEPWDAFWGPALCPARRPRRRPGQPLRTTRIAPVDPFAGAAVNLLA